MNAFSVDAHHEHLLRTRRPLLAFDPHADYGSWKLNVRDKLHELMGDLPEKVEPQARVEWEADRGSYIERRIVFASEPMTQVPCHLLVPRQVSTPVPVVICLQGHSSGMHISMGKALHAADETLLHQEDGDYALQAVRQGYAALAMEQRAFGERKSDRLTAWTTCEHPAMVALLMGRTLLRERAWDVSRAIDVLETFPEIDSAKVGLMGHSGGGTATYYTACVEPRVKIAMPSSAVCAFGHSIGVVRHCDCNYIPGLAKYVDMGELACLIAPRPLILVAGVDDPEFRYPGVEKAYQVIQQIYKKEGAPENCTLITGPAGHRFYGALSWRTFRNMSRFETEMQYAQQ